MLPKPEKNKKIKTEQLDLVTKISDETKSSKKRITLLIALLLTVGLSFIFYLYRHLGQIINHFSVPSINITLPSKKINFTTDKSIALYVQSDEFIYNFQSELLPNIDEILNILPTAPIKKIDILPSGVEVREFISSDIYGYYLNIPTKNIIIIIKTDNKEKIGKLIEKIYWEIVGH